MSDKEIVERILEILYWDTDKNAWNLDKEWDIDFLGDVAEFAILSKNIPKNLLRLLKKS